MATDHERERALAVAAAAGVLGECWVALTDAPELDWGWMLARLDEVGMAPHFWSEAMRTGIGNMLPIEVGNHLRIRTEQNVAQNAQLLAAALRAGAALDAARIEWMPIKGAALALVTPTYATIRNIGDVDLLVRPASLAGAAKALAETMPLALRHGDSAAMTADAATKAGLHHVYTFRTAEGVDIELHHSFGRLNSREINAGIWDRAAKVETRGRRIRVPSLDDLLGTACVHTLVQHAGDRRLLVRHIADVEALVGRGASVQAAASRYDGLWRRSVTRSLRDLREAREYARRSRRACAASRALDPPSALGVIVQAVRAQGFAELVPPREAMIRKYGVVASGKLLPLLHLRRWSRALLRLIKGGP